ncbi:MAG: YaaA family protein [Actinomycetes bacterium]
MLILLPPSEGKAPTHEGKTFALHDLSMPSLNPTRLKVRSALIKLCAGRESRARTVLGLSELQRDELELNRELEDARAMPASRVYTGVLYEALDYASLSAAARRRADEWVLVSSALWGAVRLNDRIPAYRLSGNVALPRLGSVTTVWRKPLQAALPVAAGDGVIFDLRSGTYAKMWTPDPDLAHQTVVGRVLHEQPDGSRVVVSHHNKATKGRLVRALATDRAAPQSSDDLATAIERVGYVVELHKGRPGSPCSLDIVVDDV